jgi:probable O-glycosylation ligase (exosortase A-associated)
MLRTTFVIILLVIGLRYSLKGAFYLLLFYLWIAYFRPDDWIHGNWVARFNISFLVGAAVIVATAFSKERFRFGFSQLLMVLFVLQTLISLIYSPALEEGPRVTALLWGTWTDFVRKVTIGLVLVSLVTTEERLRLVFVVIAASLSFEGAKQGWAQMILNPGAVNANPSPFMGDNNGVAVGMLMLIPVLTALIATSRWKIEKYIARFLLVGDLYRAISTYSRGGFLAAIAMGLHYLLRTKRKIRSLLAVGIVVAIIYPVLPDAFWNRMSTIRTAAEATSPEQRDWSSAGRLHFWDVALVMANDHPWLGVGFNSYNFLYDRYDFSGGEFGKGRAVHSAWFGMIAEVGYVGLGIFLVLFVRAFYVNWHARRLAKRRPDMANLVAYGTALETAMVVFAVGGSFVPHQYNEMLWHFVALTIVIDRLVRERIAQPVATTTVAVAAPAPVRLGFTVQPQTRTQPR